MLGRCSPTLLDLAVALVSGAAAAYATTRKDVATALSGVAIAVALAPPLATFGLLMATGEFRLASGALLLFLTNLVAIVSAVVAVFLWVGFRPNIAEQLRARTFKSGIAGTLVVLVTVTSDSGAADGALDPHGPPQHGRAVPADRPDRRTRARRRAGGLDDDN